MGISKKMNDLNKPKIQTRYTSLEIQDGILIAEYVPNIDLTLDIAQEMVKARFEYQENIILPMYVEIGLKSSTKEARDFLAKKGSELLIACAILTTSTIESLIGNVYLTFSEPTIPTKLFTSKGEAIKWLETHK